MRETGERSLRIDCATGCVAGVRYVPSPNADERPAECEPELIVVHSISLPPGEFGGPHVEALFTNRLDPEAHAYFADIVHLKVSAHAFIRRDGQLVQFVPFHRRAWHAGASLYCGRTACNDFSIGIELEGTDDGDYESVQYERLAELIRALREAYPALRSAEVVGHSDVAPGRKTDPGPGFSWARLRRLMGPAVQ